jgi:hypothetical protein
LGQDMFACYSLVASGPAPDENVAREGRRYVRRPPVSVTRQFGNYAISLSYLDNHRRRVWSFPHHIHVFLLDDFSAVYLQQTKQFADEFCLTFGIRL